MRRERTELNMKKRLISLIMAACILIPATAPAVAAASLSNFRKIREYSSVFADVPDGLWYSDSVAGAYERGIMDGKAPGLFDPEGMITIAETIKLAACIHRRFYSGSADFETGVPWYAPYADYCRENGLSAAAYRNYEAAATRSDFALMLADAVPDEALTPLNRVADGAIPDVFESYSYGAAVYKLYRAGVLTGSDDERSFLPGRTIRRAEAAAVIMRILDADSRESFSLTSELTAEQIYKLASPAVFFIEIYDKSDAIIKTGSGFFITDTGVAVTNNHVVTGAYSAKITTDDGEVYDVAGIYDYDRKKDIALIRIEGEGFPYLEFADSEKLQTGATVYTLGSPLGLQASYSRGIVSQALREIEGTEYIQIDAPISSGSSGGALLDAHGRVVGVTSATAVGAQNINLSVPINFIYDLDDSEYVPLEAILLTTEYYSGHFPAPDFGAFYGVKPFNTDTRYGETTYSYRMSELPAEADELIDAYSNLCEQNLFEFYGFTEIDDNEFLLYYNMRQYVVIKFGANVVRGRECFTVIVS